MPTQHGWTRFVSMQNHYNLLYREEEREMLPLCADQGIGVIPWSPLARGKLTRRLGRRAPHRAPDRPVRQDALRRRAATASSSTGRGRSPARRGVSRAQVALAWLLAKPVVTAPIVGATKPQHLDDAIAAVDLHLSSEDLALLEDPYVTNVSAELA